MATKRLPSNWRAIRERVLEDAGWVCAIKSPYCTNGIAEEVDHIVPRASGGGHELSNLRAACKPCHHRRAYKDERVPSRAWHAKSFT